MSFASSIKEELALKDVDYPKDELSALFKSSGTISLSNGKMSLMFKSENSKIAQKTFKMIHTFYDIKPVTSVYKSMKLKKNNVYCLTIHEKVNEILEELGLIDNNNLKNIIRSEKRIKSYLAGCFMGTGSVNDPHKTNYHLEMTFVDESFAKEVSKFMLKINLSAKIITRRNQYVVYLKKAQEIADFIAGVGATNGYLEFEDIRMTRDFYNIDNRLNNCDIANSVRTNMAANEQLKDIEIIEKRLGLLKLDKDLQTLCQLRKENPEDSLRELAEKFNAQSDKQYSKSGINHLFDKIKSIASDYKGSEK